MIFEAFNVEANVKESLDTDQTTCWERRPTYRRVVILMQKDFLPALYRRYIDSLRAYSMSN